MNPFLVLQESNTTVGTLYTDKAADIGYTPVLLTSDRSRYSFLDRVRTMEVITTNPDAVDAACDLLEREAPIRGLLSTSDYFLVAASQAARRRNLAGPDPASIALCRNKFAQRRALAAAGLPGPVFRLCFSPGDAISPEIGLPAVLKPVDGSGSVGVRLCRTPEEIREHAARLLSSKPNERGMPALPGFLAESYVDGPEYSAEIIGGRVIAVTGKHLGPPPNFIETGHDVPPVNDAMVPCALQDVMARTIAAVSLVNSPAHVEFRVVGGQVTPIEINPRVAGGNIPKLVRLATGVDLVEQCLRFYAGLPVLTDGKAGSPAAIRFLVAERPGTVTRTSGLDETLGEVGVVDAAFIRKPGDVVRIHGDFRDRTAYVIARGDTVSIAAENAARALQRLQVSVE